jgi:hypothetical protein
MWPRGSLHHNARKLGLVARPAPPHQRLGLDAQRLGNRLVAPPQRVLGFRERHGLLSQLCRYALATVTAARQLQPQRFGPIMCLTHPPIVGLTNVN